MRYSSVIKLLFYMIIFVSIVCKVNTSNIPTTQIPTTSLEINNLTCYIQKISKSTVSEIKDKCLANSLHLNVTESSLQEIPNSIFKYFVHLKTLDLSNTEVWEIKKNTFQHAGELQILKLNHNYLETLPNYSFTGAHELTQLEIKKSQIVTIEEFAFANLNRLQKLDLSNNRISSITKSMFEDLVSLQELQLNHNYLQILQNSIFMNNKQLSIISLDSNNIIDIDDKVFQHTVVKWLNLNNNSGLRKFSMNLMSIRHLEGIFLINTGLTELVIPPRALEMHANKNQIKRVRTVYDIINHKTLLKILDISDNKLTTLAGFHELSLLVELNLDGNQLYQFHPHDLTGFKDLKQLGVERNRFPWNFFAHDIVLNMPSLKTMRVTAMESVIKDQERIKKELLPNVELFINKYAEAPILPEPIEKIYINNKVDKSITNHLYPAVETQLPEQDFTYKKIKELEGRVSMMGNTLYELQKENKVDKVDSKVDKLESHTNLYLIIFGIAIVCIVAVMIWVHFSFCYSRCERFFWPNRRADGIEAIHLVNADPEDADLDERAV